MGRYSGLSYSQIVDKYKKERAEYEALKQKRAQQGNKLSQSDQFHMDEIEKELKRLGR